MFKEFFRFKSTVRPETLEAAMSSNAYYYFLEVLRKNFTTYYWNETGINIDDYSLQDFEIELKQGWYEYDPVEDEWIVWIEEN